MENALLNIKKLRKKLGLTQKDLADKIGISVTALGKIERGETRLNSDHVRTLSEAFGVSEDEFLVGETFSDEEMELRENTFRDNLVKNLREQIENLSTEVSSLKSEVQEKDRTIRDLRGQVDLLNELKLFHEHHPEL